MMASLHYPNIIQIIVINEELWWASFSNIIYEIVFEEVPMVIKYHDPVAFTQRLSVICERFSYVLRRL